MYEAAASCKDITRAPVTNWEPPGVTLAGYCYAVRHEMKFQLVTPYRFSHLRSYGVTVHGNVTSVYPPLDRTATGIGKYVFSIIFGNEDSSGHGQRLIVIRQNN
jgi:hypothetical protein